MKNIPVISVYWFRRDLRIRDNHGLYKALQSGEKILPLFIFDSNILRALPKNDARVSFIYSQIQQLKQAFQKHGSDIKVCYGTPNEIFHHLFQEYNIKNIYTNHDYEPYAVERDIKIRELTEKNKGKFFSYKDQVLFEKNEILKKDKTPYTIFTPYSKIWKIHAEAEGVPCYKSEEYLHNLMPLSKYLPFPSLEKIGFKKSTLSFPSLNYDLNIIKTYDYTRDIPGICGTSRLGLHIRFGTISIREVIREGFLYNETFVNELIWREFFMQILWHFPSVVKKCFREKYEHIEWENNNEDFERWKKGETGYPLVDAGMRELNSTGFMHNRIRMLTASFLCKHLLIDWKWGESYFSQKLLDFDLSSNNGGWQWSAGTGCDASPYFRIFNPESQMKKFDPDLIYIKKWVPELESLEYPSPIIEHKTARERALQRYKKALHKSVA